MEGHRDRKTEPKGDCPCAKAYPHALVWGHSHQPILEEDVNLTHSFSFVLARVDISEHTEPGDGLLYSWAAGRELVDARDSDGTVGSIKGGEVGAHREGTETRGDPAVPGPSFDLADATQRAASCLACQASA